MNKIFIVIENAYSYAGTEKVCDFMCDSLGDTNEVVILSLKGSGKTFYPYKKAKEIISLEGIRHPLITSANIILAEKKQSTVFVVSMGKLSVFFSILYNLLSLCNFSSRRKGKKIIACEHVSLDSFPKYVKFLKYISLRAFSNVVVLTKKDKLKLNSWGIRSTIIPNALEFHSYERNTCNKIALSIGRLETQKGFDILLRVWADFVKKEPDWKLVIAGDGSLKEELKFLAKELCIDSSVTFLGLIDNVEYYYKNSDIYLMTSRYEGLPLVLLEAKSWGLPSIAFDCPTGPAEIISDSIDGFLIPAFNNYVYLEKLSLLANDDSLRQTFSKNTEKTSRKFDSSTIKEQWKSLV
ncbi:glycosyltransferase family 4 protein [Klebsiella oxytoca]